MEQCEQALLERIGETRFACVELQLYLDTHPNDAIATADFNCYAEQLRELVRRYESTYGPLLNFGENVFAAGSWVDQKWPWEL